jgi:hypothetical protein
MTNAANFSAAFAGLPSRLPTRLAVGFGRESPTSFWLDSPDGPAGLYQRSSCKSKELAKGIQTIGSETVRKTRVAYRNIRVTQVETTSQDD